MFEWLVEPFQFEFMQRALIVAVSAALVCGVLSSWLVLLGWSLLGDAVSHAVLPGVVLAYMLGLPFAVGATVLAFIAVGLIGRVRTTTIVREDAAIGVVFTSLFAFGLVLISRYPSQIDLTHVLFGNILGVQTSDAIQVVALSLSVLVILLVLRRDLTLFAFDKGQVNALGKNVSLLSAVLLGALALTSVAALQAVGVILVVALLITPGATALLWTKRFTHMLWIAPVVGVSSAFVGITVSFYADVASGATIVLMLGVHFLAAYVCGPRQRWGIALRRYMVKLRHRRAVATAVVE
ncbi:metal ABC transporter permease [Timonella sp. A28]|uniref:metal ABC transporter permease n=1 Tax=Timonella sp. A28 TaxID=3442640 RepID=UPI003EBEA679